MMVWLVVAILLICLLALPFGMRVAYKESGLQLALKIGPISVSLYPRKASPGTKKKASKSDADKVKKPTGSKQRYFKDGISDFFPVLQLLYDLLKDFRRKLRVSVLDLKLVIAGNDPCDVAVNYGRAWAAVANLMPLLEQVLAIQYRNVSVECDFLSAKTKLLGDIELTMTVGRILHLFGFHGVKLLFGYIKIMNKRKGGARA